MIIAAFASALTLVLEEVVILPAAIIQMPCAYFSSAPTGRIQLSEFGGNIADPTGPVKIVHLELHSPETLNKFVHIANQRHIITNATITENRNPHYFVSSNLRVIGYQHDPPFMPYYPHGRAFVALSVSKWTAIAASWKGNDATHSWQSGTGCN